MTKIVSGHATVGPIEHRCVYSDQFESRAKRSRQPTAAIDRYNVVIISACLLICSFTTFSNCSVKELFFLALRHIHQAVRWQIRWCSSSYRITSGSLLSILARISVFSDYSSSLTFAQDLHASVVSDRTRGASINETYAILLLTRSVVAENDCRKFRNSCRSAISWAQRLIS